MKFWIGLYKSVFQEQLVAGIDVILSAAYKVLANQKTSKPRLLQIEGASSNKENEEDDMPETRKRRSVCR
jgi:hypothetical protein